MPRAWSRQCRTHPTKSSSSGVFYFQRLRAWRKDLSFWQVIVTLAFPRVTQPRFHSGWSASRTIWREYWTLDEIIYARIRVCRFVSNFLDLLIWHRLLGSTRLVFANRFVSKGSISLFSFSNRTLTHPWLNLFIWKKPKIFKVNWGQICLVV